MRPDFPFVMPVNYFDAVNTPGENPFTGNGSPFPSFSGLGDFLSGIWNEVGGNNAATTAYERDVEKLKMEQDFAREQQLREFEYNSYENKVKMMAAAGINPNLMSGALGGSSGSAGASPSSGSSPMANTAAIGSTLLPSFNQMVGNALLGKKGAAEIRNLDSNTNKTDVETGLLPLEFDVKNRIATATVDKLLSEKRVNDQNADLVKREVQFFDDTYETKIQAAEQGLKNLQQEFRNLREQEKVLSKEQQVMDADIALKEAQKGEAYAHAFLMGEEQTGVYTENRSKEMFYNAVKQFGDGLPFSVEMNDRIAYLAKEGKFKEAYSLLQTMNIINRNFTDQQVRNAYRNFSKDMIMKLGTNMMTLPALIGTVTGHGSMFESVGNYWDDDRFFDYWDEQ